MRNSNPNPDFPGPITVAGKKRSSRNSLKHGILSKQLILENENRAEFDSLFGNLVNDLQPEGTLEETLVESLAIVIWRGRRLISAENELISEDRDLEDSEAEFVLPSPSGLDPILRYETHLGRQMERIIRLLDRLQGRRLATSKITTVKLALDA